MSGKRFFFATTILLPTLLVSSTAFGWYGGTHSRLCDLTLSDPAVFPLWGGISSIIEDVYQYTGEPPGSWHTQQWNDIVNREYVSSGTASNGNWWWGLDEKTRLQYLQHNTTDVGVPAGHSPAGEIYPPDGWGEFELEVLRVANWGAFPDTVGTSVVTHPQTGHTYSYTGTIDQIVQTHKEAVQDNARWWKDTGYYAWIFNPVGIPPFFEAYTHSGVNYRDAGWTGLQHSLMLQRAVFVDYFLAKQIPVANSESWYDPNYGYVWFDARDSYDTDNVTWNSNGTYSNNGGGIQEYAYDFNMDGWWDVFTPASFFGVLPSDLVYWGGCPVDQWFPYAFSVRDDEYKWSESIGYAYIPSSALGGGVPEPATLSLLAVGGLALLRRKK